MTGSVLSSRLVFAVLAWFVATVVLMVGAAYLWVFLYSLLINSSGDQAFYEAYAQTASPIVAVVVAFPVFYLMGRYMRRFGNGALWGVGGVVALHALMEATVLATLSDTFTYVLAFSLIAMLLKAIGGYVAVSGGRE